MSEKNVTLRLAEFINDNCIPTKQIARETGIAEEKLRTSTTEVLTATEFLELCAYLDISPEEL